MSSVLSQLTALLPPVPADNVYLTAALWIGLALIASLISIRIGVSVALVEIVVGMLAGNFLHLQTNVWINFLAGFGSILLTFLAGAEIEPAAFRKHLRASLVLGGVSFLIPFILAMVVAYYVVGWNLQAAQIAGIALSTTSVAVVYAVMVETGLNRTEIGKLILAACFITDLGTVLALGVLFANFNLWLVVFVVVTVATLAVLPFATRYVLAHWGGRISEPEVKFIFFVLFALGGLATIAGSEAVLPAYLGGTGHRRRVHAQPSAGGSHAFHRVCAADALLFPQGWLVDLVARAADLDEHRAGRVVLAHQTRRQDRRRASPDADLWIARARGQLHDAADGDRLDIRLDLGSLWIHTRLY